MKLNQSENIPEITKNAKNEGEIWARDTQNYFCD